MHHKRSLKVKPNRWEYINVCSGFGSRSLQSMYVYDSIESYFANLWWESITWKSGSQSWRTEKSCFACCSLESIYTLHSVEINSISCLSNSRSITCEKQLNLVQVTSFDVGLLETKDEGELGTKKLDGVHLSVNSGCCKLKSYPLHVDRWNQSVFLSELRSLRNHFLVFCHGLNHIGRWTKVTINKRIRY
jgi:hypothetical protein